MLLLDTYTLKLRNFLGELPALDPRADLEKVSPTPRYAILSHCWRDGEVLFQDIPDLRHARTMAGFPKVENCCRRALNIGLEWAWIDTCCIDKSSSAELSEAINSMFKWYSRSSVCLVYLDDVDDGDPHLPCSMFRKSRWFTRGWTLQELLASRQIIFFSKSWAYLGTKDSLLTLLGDITKIPIDALSNKSPFTSFSIAQRMSWAAKRETTRTEDRAYSLLGIFDIFMPIIYGEGDAAFRRLQLEIIQRSNDQSIFAWSSERSTSLPLSWNSCTETATDDPGISLTSQLPSESNLVHSSVLAASPLDFLNSSSIVPRPVSSMVEYYWTHLGLHIRLPLIPFHHHAKKDKSFIGVLACLDSEEQSVCGIILQGDGVQQSYCRRKLESHGLPEPQTHCLVSILERDFPDRAFTKLNDVFITDEPGQGGLQRESEINSRFPLFLGPQSSEIRVSIVCPKSALRGLEETGFTLAGHASKSQYKIRTDYGGDVSLEFQLRSDSSRPVTHANLLFFSSSRNHAFSVFITLSWIVDSFGRSPVIWIDVVDHRSEEFSTLEAQAVCDGYEHHSYQEHFHVPACIQISPQDIHDAWKRSEPDSADDRPDAIHRCKGKCRRDLLDATTTTVFGDHKGGVSVTRSIWGHFDVTRSVGSCTVWVEPLLYHGRGSQNDEY